MEPWLHALDDPDWGQLIGANSPRATVVQLVLASTLGLGSFILFCILRPQWPSLYAARKKTKEMATVLPELPDTFLGWIPVLWRITDQQVLASAGLDAYVYLQFFKMASVFLTSTLFFALIIIKPVHDSFPEDEPEPGRNQTKNSTIYGGIYNGPTLLRNDTSSPIFPPGYWDTDVVNTHLSQLDYELTQEQYLVMYIAFAYLFSLICVWLLITYTRKIIQVRQEYLGSQTTATDRTIRLSGIPKHLRNEAALTECLEELVGKVESVTICRDWRELDGKVRERADCLRKLETAYTIFATQKEVGRSADTLPVAPSGRLIDTDDAGDEDEESGLLNGNAVITSPEKPRPLVTIRYGRFKLKTRKVDAIDYYTEHLRALDAEIEQLRGQDFTPTPLAFVTMTSVAAAQMAVQAVLDPSPLQLIASSSPPPSEVIWTNTYQTRKSRMLKAWIITVGIVLLTIFWSALLIPIAGLLNTEAIGRVFPQLADLLEEHENIQLLVNTQLPVLFVTILVVLVPYLYYWMSWYQGFLSVGEIELSAISKNFFFTFFNLFVVFTILGTVSEFIKFLSDIGKVEGFQNIAYTLALSLQRHLRFYCNYIILQSLTLHPLRLLELGSVFLYPIYLMGAKTPRDFAELVQPPFFSYGFYLPNALLVFIICMVYGVFRESYTVQASGLAFFLIGHFVYKYQLLYAMDHSPHSTGRAWGMICDRIFVGMGLFQATVAGQLILKGAIKRSLLMFPLIVGTIWFSIVFGRTYKPLLRYIALANIRKTQHEDYTSPDDPLPDAVSDAGENVWADGDENRPHREASTNSPVVRQQSRYVNPSLTSPLRGVWLANKNFEDGMREQPGSEAAADAANILRRPPFY